MQLAGKEKQKKEFSSVTSCSLFLISIEYKLPEATGAISSTAQGNI